MVSAEPLIEATEVFINPEPVIVEEKIPKGSWPEVPAAVMLGAGGWRVIMADAKPPRPVTVTVSLPEAGMAAGAV